MGIRTPPQARESAPGGPLDASRVRHTYCTHPTVVLGNVYMVSEKQTESKRKMPNKKGQHSPEERQRMVRSDRTREGGFTLIEVVLVVILVGIMAAVAIPRFPTFPKTGAVATKLTRDIRYAKELADRVQTMCGVYFIDSSSYRVFQDNDTSTAAIDPITGKGFVVTLSGKFSGVTLSQSFAGNTLKFNALGTPLDGSDTPLAAASTITVSGTGGDRTVTVEPNTGKVNAS